MKKLSGILFTFFALPALAQDLNYWTNQFGTRSSLMGGAVVGGVKDNTAVYYNPAALAFIDSASVSASANIYRIENIKLTNAVGENKDFSSLNLGSIPLLVGGRLRTKNPNFKLGYGLVVPTAFTFRGGARTEGFYPISNEPGSPGDEEYTGQANVNTDLRETVAMVGLAWKINNRLSWGFSNMIMVRTHNYTEATVVRMFLNNASKTMVAVNDIESARYTHIAYSPKLGINYLAGKWSWGLSVQVPGIRLYSSASTLADITGNQLNLLGTGRIDFSGSDAQEKLKAKFKYPVSVAAGGVYDAEKYRLAFTAQYYSGIDPYSIISPEAQQFLRPAATFPNSTTDKFLQVRTAAKPVLNAAIAIEKPLSEKLLFTGSFRTDFSAYDNIMRSEQGIKPYITTWDIYHLAGGVTLHQGRHDLSLGMNFAYGADNNYSQNVNLEDPAESNFLQGQLGVAKAKYFSAGFILGYTYLFRR